MANVRTILDKVWSDLRQANVVDDLAIIEYIAALLIEDKSWPFDENVRPQKPRVRYNPNDEVLKNQLYHAAAEIDNKDIDKGTATLFDQHALFYSSRYQEQGNYPTPGHIVDFMLEILEVQKVHNFADFTCGSGRFLIHRYQHEKSSRNRNRGITLGVDISPDWIRIAHTNVFLHQLANNIKLYTGDVLRLNEEGQELASMSFDRIAVSPPLNIPMKSARIYKLFPEIGPNTTTVDSDSILAALLQQKLTASGKGAILVSEGAVTRASRTTQFLRSGLVRGREVQAVIELNPSALFPSEKEQAYILVVNKQKQESTWFLKIERDGYEESWGRDLTESPNPSPTQNDIPFVQAVAKLTGKELELQDIPIDGHQGISRLFIEQGKRTIGVVIKIHQEVRITEISYEQSEAPKSARLQLYIQKNIDNYKATSHEDINLPYLANNDASRRIIFQHGKAGQMIALSLDGRLVGMTFSAEEIAANRYDLRPNAYLKQYYPESNPRMVATTNADMTTSITPATPNTIPILAQKNEVLVIPPLDDEPEIYPNRRLAIELPKAPVTPPLLIPLPDSIYPFSTKQRAIWEYIKKLHSTDKYAAYFSADQLGADIPLTDILSALDQLERLGLIIRVRIKHEEDDIPTYYYRRLLVTDISHVSTALKEQLPEEIKNVLPKTTSDNEIS